MVKRLAAAYDARGFAACSCGKVWRHNMKARWFRTCGVLFACATLTLVACGDDSTPDAGAAGTSAGGSGGAGGSTSGSGGGGAGKAGGGGGGSMAITCGGSPCTVNGTLKSIN